MAPLLPRRSPVFRSKPTGPEVTKPPKPQPGTLPGVTKIPSAKVNVPILQGHIRFFKVQWLL